MSIKAWWMAVAAVCGLSACGDTLGDQALAGSAIGAGAAVVVNGSLVKGAVIGAAGNIVYCELNPSKCR